MPFQKGHLYSKGKNNPFYGRKHSDKTKKKMRLAKLGKLGHKWSIERKRNFSVSEETKEKLRKGMIGNQYAKGNLPNKTSFKKGHQPKTMFEKGHLYGKRYKKGHIPYSKLHPEIMRRGCNHPHWKGGISSLYDKVKQSKEYKEWRRDVFIRDRFTCQQCGHRFTKIVAHHIKLFSEYKDLWFMVNNGLTLCRSCHKKIHNR